MAWAGCSFDSDQPAPIVGPPTGRGVCGDANTLIPKLLAFVRSNEIAPLRAVLEQHLVPSDGNPHPDPSLRVLVGDAARLIKDVGLARTELILDVAKSGHFESQVQPLVSTVLKFLDGRLDGRTHYEPGNAAAVFLRQCNPDHLLTAVEAVLRLRSPSHGNLPWLFALIQDVSPLVDDPALVPFLDSFQREGDRGRPAIIAIFTQIMVTVADDNFSIDHVETLLQSAIYPVVSPELRGKIEPLIRLLDEATRRDAGVLVPLQNAVRCGLAHPGAKDDLLGLLYDLVAIKEVGLPMVLDAVNAVLKPDIAADELHLLADVTGAIRKDLAIRDDLREVLAMLLSSPQVGMVVPVLIDVIDQGVMTELIDAFAKLLNGCTRG